MHHNHLEGPTYHRSLGPTVRVSNLVGLGYGPRICISNQFQVMQVGVEEALETSTWHAGRTPRPLVHECRERPACCASLPYQVHRESSSNNKFNSIAKELQIQHHSSCLALFCISHPAV